MDSIYGRFQFEDPIYEFLQEKMTAEEKTNLRELNRRYGDDCDAINRWLNECSMVVHPEAQHVYFTGYLLMICKELHYTQAKGRR